MKFARRKFNRSLVLPYAFASHFGAINATRLAKLVWLARKPQALRTRRKGIRHLDGPKTFRVRLELSVVVVFLTMYLQECSNVL